MQKRNSFSFVICFWIEKSLLSYGLFLDPTPQIGPKSELLQNLESVIHFNTMLRIPLVHYFRAMTQRKEYNLFGPLANG